MKITTHKNNPAPEDLPEDYKTSEVPLCSRTGVISWLAYLMGGHNASAGTNWGRLRLCVDPEDDKAVARYFYNEISDDQSRPLKDEITRLKARIYDLEQNS